jgi:hypothetical protein
MENNGKTGMARGRDRTDTRALSEAIEEKNNAKNSGLLKTVSYGQSI